jgi:hypothetical protein
MDLPRERAVERAARRARRRLGTRFDQIGDGLGLREVQLVVQERATREFARLREPQPEAAAGIEAALQQQLHHDRPAMTLQLEHMLAGVRMRRGKYSAIPRSSGAPCASTNGT